MTQSSNSKQDLHRAMFNLGERQKELGALYELTRLLVQRSLTVEEVLAGAVTLLPAAMQFPEYSRVMIEWGDAQYTVGEFKPGLPQIRARLNSEGGATGDIVIAYDETVPLTVTGPFLVQEQLMLDHFAAAISVFLDYKNSYQEFESAEANNVLFERIINHGPAIAFIWESTTNWPVVYVSGNIKSLGYQPEDFRNGKLNYQALIHPEDSARVTSEVSHNLKQGLDQFEQRYRLATKSGEVRLIHDWTFVNRGADGEVTTIEGIILDITENAEVDARARKYLNQTNDIYLVLDSQGQVLDANDKACLVVEATRDQLIGSNWVEKYVPDDAYQPAFDYFSSIANDGVSGVQEFESDIVSMSGERHTIHWYHSLEWGDNDEIKAVIIFGADVTELRRSEKRASDYSHFMHNNPNPVLSIGDEGDVLLANDAAQSLINDIAQTGELGAKSWRDLIASASKCNADCMQEVVVGDRVFLFRGSRGPKEKQTKLYGLDITNQKNLNNRLQTIANNIPGGLFEYVMAPDGSDSIDYINTGCEEIWEVSSAELNRDASVLWAMVHPDDLAGMRNSVLESGQKLSHWSHEWRIQTRSGKTKWLRSSGSPFRHSDGSIAWITIIIDITEAKNAEAAISEALRKTVFVLSAALEARDPYTAGHEQRVTRIAGLIGREMGLDQHRMTGLELAAMVHDVGKIKVPSEILSKPGSLTAIEFELIKVHPVVGAELLKDIDFEWPISEIIRQHHERMDGSGYPDGLIGDDILLEARIIAVADTLEAMASHRPYRPGLGIEKAAEEIRQGAGKRYDEQVARACLRLVAEGKIELN